MANFVIDKSRFNDEQRAQYEALVAIGKAEVDPEANKDEMEKETTPEVTPKKKPIEKAEVQEMEKSASPEIKAAMERLETLEKSFEMKAFTEIAKKYAPLGEKEEELAQRLYDMKKSNPANYDAYVAILDKSLGMVEKSGLFAEIGKSAGGTGNGNGSVQSKVEAKAQEIMKSDHVDYNTAIAKAWEDPALMAEYDSEYFRN